MSEQSRKLAAVAFVNHKGERSMKRVKVERYKAGKKPSYAQDEDDEYYTTDEEDADIDEDDRSQSEDEDRYGSDVMQQSQGLSAQSNHETQVANVSVTSSDEDDDDPRMKKLNRLKKQGITSFQTIQSKLDVDKQKVQKLQASEDETEEEIRMRHKLARSRILDPPIGITGLFGDHDQMVSHEDIEYESKHGRATTLDTDDILGDFMPTGLKQEDIKLKEDIEAEQELQNLIEQAKEEAILRVNLEKKLEEDIRMDRLREAQSKGDFKSNKMSSVITDDEEEEFGPEYQAWKERQIKRVVRDHLEKLCLNPETPISCC